MRIVVGITGGIAAYKVPELVRLLVKAGHEVRCAATEHALQFVTRPTLETVSGAPLYCDLFASGGTEHISLKDWGELLVVAPATANIIGKVAAGVADDALSTLLLAFSAKPVVMAPAMNSDMWAHPAVQRNLATLRGWGIGIVGPAEGELACGVSGTGRMAEPAEIVRYVATLLQHTEHTECTERKPLQGQRWLVTAGPTYEKIDAVRFIGNYSSGKMGFALAEALAEAGAEVELVAGPTHLDVSTNQHINLHRVESAREMYAAATEVFPDCQGAILSAAVADYRPAEQADHKLKKQGDEGMTLRLVQNPDILATLGTMKRDGQRLVGFALETDNELQNAEGKLRRKNLDYIVMNSLRDAGAGFGVDTNKVTILGADGSRKESPLMTKTEIARLIVNTVALTDTL
ncbi:MAG: bifunctional phosphopantothenoylcysteine decarboxylase/phosphopantothenate--cysteine ligase CoaBC [Bacteroidales bacterium]|nr:bifunctional phosphopantothenoylcysteine decarboxylase/phosphopantothenate--cysteine ligase CoaBC [Bacteroidales bacterium]